MLICSGVAYDDSDSPSALQYVHRNFFARAILESAAEPLRSPFAPSFLATYRTATTKLKLLTKFYDVSSDSLNKWAPMWSSALISGVSATLISPVLAHLRTLLLGHRGFRRIQMSKCQLRPTGDEGFGIYNRDLREGS